MIYSFNMSLLILYTFPLILANLIHHYVVIPNNLFAKIALPIDCGLRLYDDPLLGTQKTFRGFIVVTVVTSVLTVLFDFFLDTHSVTNPLQLGALLGFAYMVGELPNSFIKRRFHIKESTTASGKIGRVFAAIDHIDSIIAAGFMFYILEHPSLLTMLILFIFGATPHICIDASVRKIGYKKSLI